MCVDQLVLLLEKAQAMGLSANEILRECGHSFTIEDFRDRRIRQVPADAYAQICEACVRLIRERGGCGIGHLMSRADLDLVCHALVTTLSLREAVDRLSRMYALLDRKYGWIVLSEDGQTSSLEVHLGPSEDCWLDFFRVVGSAFHARLFSWLIGEDIEPSIAIKETENGERRLIANLVSIPVHFGQAFNGLVFPTTYLDRPTVRDGLAMVEFLKVFPFNVFSQEDITTSLSTQVAATYRESILKGREVPDMYVLSKNFGMSAATFRRRLHEEGASVRKIKDAIRHELALDLLSADRLHTDQIAALLGFSCSNAFGRAFMEWQGVTPAAYRRLIRCSAVNPASALQTQRGGGAPDDSALADMRNSWSEQSVDPRQ